MKRLLVALLLLYPLSALAETYEWTDERGTVNFTEDLGKVPKKYRKRVKVLGAEESPAPKSSVAPEPEPAQPKADEAQKGKKLYGGRDESAWRKDFLTANGELESAESELSALRERLQDTSKMSRSEYLAIQNTMKHAESRVARQQRKLDSLRENADRFGVPAGVRQ